MQLTLLQTNMETSVGSFRKDCLCRVLFCASTGHILPGVSCRLSLYQGFRAYVYQSIHAQSIIASMFESIRLPEHPFLNQSNIHVQEHTFYQSIHAQTMVTSMFESIRLPEHPCPNHSSIHVREHTFTCWRAYVWQGKSAPFLDSCF